MSKKKIPSTCIQCNKEYLASTSSGGIYCSNRCQRDYGFANTPFEEYKQDRTRRFYLIRERGHQCECCKNTNWNDLPIPLELDHIDGNHQNNVLENVRLLCPNCHAQTPTYKNRNAGNGRTTRRKQT